MRATGGDLEPEKEPKAPRCVVRRLKHLSYSILAGPRIVDQGSRFLGKMQGYVQGHTPLETERSCTDCLFIPLFVAAIVGFFFCISQGSEKGGFQRLTALPDFEGNLCGTNGQGPYLYFCRQEGIGVTAHLTL